MSFDSAKTQTDTNTSLKKNFFYHHLFPIVDIQVHVPVHFFFLGSALVEWLHHPSNVLFSLWLTFPLLVLITGKLQYYASNTIRLNE